MKENGMQQPKKFNMGLVAIFAVIALVSATIFAIVVTGDENDGIDHQIKYSSDQIWQRTYDAIGVDPGGKRSSPQQLEGLLKKASLPLGASSDLVKSDNQDLNLWINQQAEGNYLLDTFTEEDGCTAFVVMDPVVNELSVISFNEGDTPHTFRIIITNPTPYAAVIETFQPEDIPLGHSGMTPSERGPTVDREGFFMNQPDPVEHQDSAPAPASRVSQEQQNPEPLSTSSISGTDSTNKLDDLLTPTATGPSGESRSISVSTRNLGDTLELGGRLTKLSTKPPASLPEEPTDPPPTAPAPPRPKQEESEDPTVIGQGDGKKPTPEDEQDLAEAPKPPTSKPESSTVEKKPIPGEQTDAQSTPVPSSSKAEPATSAAASESSVVEQSSSAQTPPPASSTGESTVAESSPQSSVVESTQNDPTDAETQPESGDERLSEPAVPESKPEFEPDLDLSHEIIADDKIASTFTREVEDPKNGVMMTVPAGGGGVAKIRINERLEEIPGEGFLVNGNADFVLYSKDDYHTCDYLTWSETNHTVKYKFEETTRLIFTGGTGTDTVSMRLQNKVPVTLAQVVNTTNDLLIHNSPQLPWSGDPANLLPDTELVTINSILQATAENPHGLSSTGSLQIVGPVSLGVVSERQGGSGIHFATELMIGEGAHVVAEGETFGVSASQAAANLRVENQGSLKATAAQSRTNRSTGTLAGIYLPEGQFLMGDQAVVEVDVSTLPLVTPPTAPSGIWPADEIKTQAKSFGIYAGSGQIADPENNPGTSKLTVVGGDVGAYFAQAPTLKNGVTADFTGNWVGLFMDSGTGKITDLSTRVSATATGLDSTGKPIGVGIFSRESLEIGKDKTLLVLGSVDQYDTTTAPVVTAQGSQIGIYLATGHLTNDDGATTIAKGGVPASYDGAEIPPLVEKTYGIYVETGSYLSASYNSKLVGYGGAFGINNDSLSGKVETHYSAQMLGKGNDTGIRSNFSMACMTSSYMQGHGNRFGITNHYDVGAQPKSGVVDVGEIDTNVASLGSITMLEGYGTNGFGFFGARTINFYKNTYVYGEGDVSGVYAWEKVKSYPTAEHGIRVVGKTNPYLEPLTGNNSYPHLTWNKTYGAAVNAFISASGSADQLFVHEIYDSPKGIFGFYDGSPFITNQYNLYPALNTVFGIDSAKATMFHWSTNNTPQFNKAAWPSNKFADYGYMQLGDAQLAHNDSEFQFQRYASPKSGHSQNDVQGVTVMPLKSYAKATVIADGYGGASKVVIPGWSANYFGKYGISAVVPTGARHRISFLDTRVNAIPAINVQFSSYRKDADGTLTKLPVSNYWDPRFEIQYLAPGATDRINYVITGKNIIPASEYFTMAKLPVGEYWFTDKTTDPSIANAYHKVPMIHFKVEMETVNDGIVSSYPYERPFLTVLNDDNQDNVNIPNRGTLYNYREIPQGLSYPSSIPTGDYYQDRSATRNYAEMNLYLHPLSDHVELQIADKDDERTMIGGTIRVKEFASKTATTPSAEMDFVITQEPGSIHMIPTVDLRYYEVTFVSPDGVSPMTTPKEYLAPEPYRFQWSYRRIMAWDQGTSPAGYKIINNPSTGVSILKALPQLPQKDIPVSTVYLDPALGGAAVPLIGAEYRLSTATYNGKTDPVQIVKDTTNSGQITLVGLKPLHQYTLTQTLATVGYEKRQIQYQFSLVVDPDHTGDLTNWKILHASSKPNPLDPEDGWIGTQPRSIEISNEKIPYADMLINLEAHGLWNNHGEGNFLVKVVDQDAVPPRTYYQLVTFASGADRSDQVESCPLFNAAAAAHGDHTTCPSFGNTTVLFKDMRPGNYQVTVIPPDRFAATSLGGASQSLTFDPTTPAPSFAFQAAHLDFFSGSGQIVYSFEVDL